MFTDLQITILEKLAFNNDDNQLTKTVKLNGSGYESDGSPCKMVRGKAFRRSLKDLDELGEMFHKFGKQHAIALGRLRDGLPDRDMVITTKKERRRDAAPHIITRTNDYFVHAPGREALVLIDTDYKGATTVVRERIAGLGGLQQALAAVLPALAAAYRLVRPSTSSGLFNAETGEQFAGSLNAHTYVAVKDGSDSE